MDVNGILHVARIAAGHGDRHRKTGFVKMLQNKVIPLRQPFLGYGKATEPVVQVGISAGQANHKIGGEILQGPDNPFIKGFKIGGIIRPISQLNIQITFFFVKGKVIFAMDGKGEDSGIVFKNSRRSVSLVDIAVYNQYISDKTFGLYGSGCNYTVV